MQVIGAKATEVSHSKISPETAEGSYSKISLVTVSNDRK